jgi:hypothetical protein
MDFEQDKIVEQDNPEQLGEPAAPPAVEEEPQAAPPPESVPYSRLQEVSQKKNEYKTEAERLKQQVDMLNMQLLQQNQPVLQQPQQQVQSEMPVKPNPNDFSEGTYDEKYVEQLSSYHYKMNKMKEQSEVNQRSKEDRYRINAQQHNLRAAVFAQKNPDYFTVAESNPYVSQYTAPMVQAIMASDRSPEVAYYLGKNPTEAIRISNSAMPAMEIGKIAATISRDTATKQVSMAPQPITPVGNTNAANEKQPGADKMSYEEYKAKMNARESQGRGAGNWGR